MCIEDSRGHHIASTGSDRVASKARMLPSVTLLVSNSDEKRDVAMWGSFWPMQKLI